MTEPTEPKKRKRLHTLRQYTITLTDGTSDIIESDDLRKAKSAAKRLFGPRVANVTHTSGSRRNDAWQESTTSTSRTGPFMKQRRANLDTIAVENGWKSWYEYETAVLSRVVDISTGS